MANSILELQLEVKTNNQNFEAYFSLAEKYTLLNNFFDAKHLMKTGILRSIQSKNLEVEHKCREKLNEIYILERAHEIR